MTMTLAEAAEAMGVTPRTVHRTIKRTGMWWRLTKHKGAYALTDYDVLTIATVLKARNLAHLRRTLTPETS